MKECSCARLRSSKTADRTEDSLEGCLLCEGSQCIVCIRQQPQQQCRRWLCHHQYTEAGAGRRYTIYSRQLQSAEADHNIADQYSSCSLCRKDAEEIRMITTEDAERHPLLWREPAVQSALPVLH